MILSEEIKLRILYKKCNRTDISCTNLIKIFSYDEKSLSTSAANSHKQIFWLPNRAAKSHKQIFWLPNMAANSHKQIFDFSKVLSIVLTRRRPIKPNLANFRVWVIAKDWRDVEPIKIALTDTRRVKIVWWTQSCPSSQKMKLLSRGLVQIFFRNFSVFAVWLYDPNSVSSYSKG